MEYLHQLIDGITTKPFVDLLHMLELPPGRLWPSFSLLAAVIIVCELTRISIATVFTRSRVVHLAICLLTFSLQAILLAAVLIHADRHHAGRGWINLGLAALLYGVWYATGELTRLVRYDSEGADLGFMAVGALITFPIGIVFAAIT